MFNNEWVAVNRRSFLHPHVRCTLVARTCRWPNGIKENDARPPFVPLHCYCTCVQGNVALPGQGKGVDKGKGAGAGAGAGTAGTRGTGEVIAGPSTSTSAPPATTRGASADEL